MKTKFSGILTLLLAFVVQVTFAQTTVSGTVSEENGPLPGASVLVKGTSTGTQTDFDGNYSINASPTDVLVFSYVGYANQEITVGGQTTINLTLAPDNTLDEVVVVAYGTQTKETVSSAISVIEAEEISQVPIASVDQLFQGQAAGLNAQTTSGQPGASSFITIRGRSSINGQVEPLFVIDGIPVDEDTFRNINSNDIENVSILKDASASALYGNRAAGGVIVITTKSGKYEAAPEFTYRSLYGTSSNTDPGFEVLNTRQYLTLQRENNINNVDLGNLNNLTDEEFEALIQASPNTDWVDIFFRKGRTNTQELTWSSGSEKATTFNSVQYFEQEGITRGSDLQRFSFRSNNTIKPNDKFEATSQFSASYSTNNFAASESSGNLANPFLAAYLGRPEVNAFNEDGTLDIEGDGGVNFNNLTSLALNSNILNRNEDQEIRLIGSLGFKYKFVKNLTGGVRTGIDYRNIRGRFLQDPLSLRALNDQNGAPGIGDFKGSQTESLNVDFTTNTTVNLTYANTFGDKHNFEGSIFQEYFKRHTEFNSFTAFGIDPRLTGSGVGIQPGTTPQTDDAGEETFPFIPTFGISSADLGILSYFAVARYDYDNIFGFQGSVRRDGSSRFAEQNRWGTFGALSGFWNLHKEVFANSNVIDEFKLRASYGTVGAQEIAGSALGGLNIPFDTFSLGAGYSGLSSIFLSNIGNPNAQWETTRQANIGIDFRLWNNKVSGNLDGYRNVTDDLFSTINTSGTVSTFGLAGNFGSLKNEGIEFGLNVNAIKTEDFSLGFFGNVGYNQNEILELNLAEGQTEQITGRTALAEGEAIGSFFLVDWVGVNPANGRPLYRDIDGNITDVFSDADRVFQDGKTTDPKFVGGFGANATYKGFYLDGNFSFAADQWRSNGSFGVLEAQGSAIIGFANAGTGILRAWQEVGDVTDIPALSFNDTRLDDHTRLLEDASFLRLRNVTLGHKFEFNKSNKNSLLNNLNVYLRGTNLLTWSKWRGFDPEGSSIASTFFEFPTARTFSFGVEAKF